MFSNTKQEVERAKDSNPLLEAKMIAYERGRFIALEDYPVWRRQVNAILQKYEPIELKDFAVKLHTRIKAGDWYSAELLGELLLVLFEQNIGFAPRNRLIHATIGIEEENMTYESDLNDAIDAAINIGFLLHRTPNLSPRNREEIALGQAGRNFVVDCLQDMTNRITNGATSEKPGSFS